MQRKSKWPRNTAEDNLVLGIPKPRKEERHAIKGSPQSAPRRKDEYSRTRMGVQCRSGSRKSCHLRIECANKRPSHVNGKRPLNSVTSVIATNRKWGKAADETCTRVVTYLINRWKVRINWEGLYNVRIHPREKGGQIVSRAIEPYCKKNNKNIKLLGRGPRTGATQTVPRRKSSWIR